MSQRSSERHSTVRAIRKLAPKMAASQHTNLSVARRIAIASMRSVLGNQDGNDRRQIKRRIDLQRPVSKENLLRAAAGSALVHKVKISERAVKKQRQSQNKGLAVHRLKRV